MTLQTMTDSTLDALASLLRDESKTRLSTSLAFSATDTTTESELIDYYKKRRRSIKESKKTCTRIRGMLSDLSDDTKRLRHAARRLRQMIVRRRMRICQDMTNASMCPNCQSMGNPEEYYTGCDHFSINCKTCGLRYHAHPDAEVFFVSPFPYEDGNPRCMKCCSSDADSETLE